MSQLAPSAGVFAAAATSVVILDHTNVWPHLSQIKSFYKHTPGAERLLSRAKRAHCDIGNEAALAAVIPDGKGGIGACALLYHHGDDVSEIGSVLVAPGASGQYPLLREALVKEAHALGRIVTLFERIPETDPVLADMIYAQRRAEGWQTMHWEDPVFQKVERAKSGMALSSNGFPPKTGFQMAVGSGMIFASSPQYDRECQRRRNPAYTLGR